MSSGLHFSNYSTWRITVGWRMDCRGQDGRRAAAGGYKTLDYVGPFSRTKELGLYLPWNTKSKRLAPFLKMETIRPLAWPPAAGR